MITTITLDKANCPTCFTDTLRVLGHIEGVANVTASSAGPCIEIDHGEGILDAVMSTVREHLHGVEVFGNEIMMVSVDAVINPTGCTHHPTPPPAKQV